MHRMTLAEAGHYMAGQDRRARQGWEQTRLLCGLVYKVLTGEDFVLDFPWDEKTDAEVTTPEEMERLRALARKIEAAENAKG